MSTAKWGGVKLRDVLRECGLDVDAIALGEKMPPHGIQHIQLEGYDQDETGYTYGGSFPIEKAVDGLGEVILGTFAVLNDHSCRKWHFTHEYTLTGGPFPTLPAFMFVFVAYEMNGKELPRDHGYPVRMIIPGHVGARQVKWLHKIKLSNVPSQKSYQCKSYLGFAPNITFEKDLANWPPPRLDQGEFARNQCIDASCDFRS